MPVHESFVRKLSVVVNEGSGCLFQPATQEYTYVLTVKHNVAEEESGILFDNIKIIKFYPQVASLTPIKTYLHPTLDLALIKVPYQKELNFPIFFNKPQRNDRLRIAGYPSYKREGDDDWLQTILARADIDTNDSQYEVIGEQPFFTAEKTPQETIIGFSGSGLFDESSELPVLKGMMPSLVSAGGEHNRLNVLNIHCFNEIIIREGLLPILPKCLINFEDYSNASFTKFADEVQFLLEQVFKERGHTISPFQIIEVLKRKLFLPFKDNYKDHVIDFELWKGWLVLLSFLWIIGDDKVKVNEVIKVLANEQEIMLRYFHAEGDKRMSDFLEFILNDVYSEINANENIIIHSSPPPLHKHYTQEQLSRMLRNICAADFRVRMKNEIDIDNPNSVKPINIFHLTYMEEGISSVDFLGDLKLFREAIKQKLLTILN